MTGVVRGDLACLRLFVYSQAICKAPAPARRISMWGFNGWFSRRDKSWAASRLNGSLLRHCSVGRWQAMISGENR